MTVQHIAAVSAKSNTYKPEAMEWDALPFISRGKVGEGRIFWAPRPTGDYAYDCGLGALYGKVALPHLFDSDMGPNLLSGIALGLLQSANVERERGVVVGMFSVIGQALARGA